MLLTLYACGRRRPPPSVTAVESLIGVSPFCGIDQEDTAGRILWMPPVLSDQAAATTLSPAALSFVRRCLNKDPHERATAAEPRAPADSPGPCGYDVELSAGHQAG